jgi:hypothetical protein
VSGGGAAPAGPPAPVPVTPAFQALAAATLQAATLAVARVPPDERGTLAVPQSLVSR